MVEFNKFMKDGWSYPKNHCGGNVTKNVASKLTEMNVVVFGDSISDPKVNGMWVKPFKELVTCKSFTNYARGYCTWTFKSDSEYNIEDVSNSNVGNNVIWNQFNRLKNDVDNGNVVNPDLIIIFAGTNDALQAKPIGDADATFVPSTQGDITTLTNLIDSIRYVCDAIYSKYPDSSIVLCTPLPLAQGGYAQCIKVHDAIVKCAERMGLYYIDATYESGIAWYREKLSPTYYTSGGVHMTNEGGEHIAKFLYGALTNLVGYVTGASGGNTSGDEPSLDTIDKTALNTAITTANNDLSSVLISEDGADILATLQWVTQSVYDDFNSAIATATAEYISEESTQETVETARTDLIFAKETFDNAKAYGTKTNGDDPVTDTGIVTIDGVDYDISVASDYPYKMIVNVSDNKRLYASNNRFYIRSTTNTECMTADSYYSKRTTKRMH